MIRLSKSQVLKLHQRAVGICDDSMLDSALNAPFQIFDNVALFPSIIEKAARL